ncbi:MAG TPA: dihydroorotate dehydrogenase [Thermotogota bacterium]|nr:dihydroorotate dehydrogenase [Thermotogota bacterium]HPJ87717.1 dihydroorotate dehydrogenase [Thermotogota bacterium]HPR94843.1 dihydroorotate dehydrogenase [Thermotogota bacterium]
MKKVRLSGRKRIEDFLLLRFEHDEPIEIKPGQFLMLKNHTEPVLAKPFSVLGAEKNGFTMLIKVIGRFTNYLSEALIGEEFFARGPYGVPYAEKLDLSRKYIVIGGGCGAAPMIHFSDTFSQNTEKLILGFKTENLSRLLEGYDIVAEEKDGMNVVDALEHHLETRTSIDVPQVLACGSIAMCKALDDKAKELGIKLFVSLDERMGCGIGMCKGCPVKTTRGIQMVCKDGPLFDSDELLLDW